MLSHSQIFVVLCSSIPVIITPNPTSDALFCPALGASAQSGSCGFVDNRVDALSELTMDLIALDSEYWP